ncbi:DNA-binding helix-turn-helix protein [[Clostridium] methylpentosum DSM 5476]|uniref:DNA-binding helix-turn-helix protein n=1 Tax=[Clostridium] methylpentosum DSM 5476 TaxID=537013 RepID=C0EDT0_9FIRM|nr:DNA-binding helix-turn-helix protein [[Clostridium] methylpentosum DSM 5476]
MATITKRGNTYKITVSCGYDSGGKQIRQHMTWKPAPGMTKRQIEKELERQKVLFEENCRSGQFISGSIKLADFAQRWMSEYAEKHLKAKTIAHYNELLKRILPALGHIKLDKLQPHHLIQFYDNLSESGIREDIKQRCSTDFKKVLKQHGFTKVELSKRAGVSVATLDSVSQGKNITGQSARRICEAFHIKLQELFTPVDADRGLAAKTINSHHRLLSSMLNTAVQWQIIFSNPCDRVKPPKLERKEARYLDEKQTAQLITCLQREPEQYQTMVLLLIYTGMRRGELCGLEWPDFDMEHKLLYIQRESLYLPDRGIFEDTTKTYSSTRVIKLSDEAVKLLIQHKFAQNAERAKLGDAWVDTGKIFTTCTGKPIHPDTLTTWFHKFVQKNDLPPVSVHSLRHTNATLLIANGVNLTTVAGRLGHADTGTTTKVYAHAIKTADEMAAETIQNILNPAKKEENIG